MMVYIRLLLLGSDGIVGYIPNNYTENKTEKSNKIYSSVYQSID